MRFMTPTRPSLFIASSVVGMVVLLTGIAAAQDPAQAVLRDDLYIAGQNVVVSRDVPGDLVAAGRKVVVKGKVAQDAFVAGGTVEIAGDIGDVLRVAGGNVTVGGDVGGYLVAGGGTVDLLPTGQVEGGVFVNGARVTVGGTIHGPLEIRGGEARINGTVEGEVTVHAGKLVLGDHAVLKKDLVYTSKKDAEIVSGAQVLGSMRRLEGTPAGQMGKALAFLPTLATFFGLIVAGIVVVLVFPKFSRSVTTESLAHFGRDLFVGGGVLILAPVAAILLVVSLIGLPLGIIGGLAYVTMLLVSRICAGLVLGTMVWRLVMKEKEARVDWKTAVVGLALLPAVAWIPILGWVAWVTLVVAALGSVSLMVYRGVWPGRGPHIGELVPSKAA
jgi:cytoskeletal protein CcmA (bactofilin family)